MKELMRGGRGRHEEGPQFVIQKKYLKWPERSIWFRKNKTQFLVFLSLKGGQVKVRNMGQVGEHRGSRESKRNPTDNERKHRWKRGQAEMLE